MNQEIIKYISEARDYGINDKQIVQNLVSAGWKKELIEGSFKFLQEQVLGASQKNNLLVFEKEKVRLNEPLELKITKIARFKKNFAWIFSKYTALLVTIIIGVVFSYSYFENRGYWTSGFNLVSYKSVWSGFLEASDEENFSGNILISLKDDRLGSIPLISKNNNLSDKFIIQKLADGNLVENHNLELSIDGNEVNSFFYAKFSNTLAINPESLKNYRLASNSYDEKLWPSVTRENIPFSLVIPNKMIKPYLRDVSYASRSMGKVTLTARVDKEKLFGDLETITKTIFSDQAKYSDQDVLLARLFTQKILTNLDSAKIELIIGEDDFRLYEMSLHVDFPSLGVLYSLAPSKLLSDLRGSDSKIVSDFESALDVKRLQDVKKVASALELYFNDNQAYPEAREGIPQDFFPKYLTTLPIAPQATGDCSDFYNTYWYTASKPETSTGKIGSYNLSFCLGTNQQDLLPGIGSLSPQGVTTNHECIDVDRPCFIDKKTDSEMTSIVNHFFDDIDETTRFEYNIKFEDYGLKKALSLPDKTVDDEIFVISAFKALFQK